MIDEIRDLNEEFFDLYERLDEKREFLPRAQAELMEDQLLEAYKKELRRLMLEDQSKTAIEEYELQAKCNALIPKKTGLFRRRNTLMKILDEKIARWFYDFLVNLRGEAPSEEEAPKEPQNEPVTVEEVTPEEEGKAQAESPTRAEEPPQSGGELVEASIAYEGSVSETKKQ